MTTLMRYAANSLINDDDLLIDFSSGSSQADATNIHKPERYRVWNPQGYFLITSSNNKIYIYDGSNKTITLDSGGYEEPSDLYTEMMAKLNASSSGWTVTYTSDFKFNISRSSSGKLRYSQTSNAIWDTIGHTGSVDVTAMSFPGDEVRIHTHEYIIYDLLTPVEMQYFALIGQIGEVFSLSSSAVIKIQANSSNVWTSPPLDQTVTRNDFGAFHYFTGSSTYRYWRLYIQDRTNSLGPSGITLSQMYLGSYEELSQRNVSVGFNKNYIDNSKATKSYSGVKFFNDSFRQRTFKNLSVNFLTAADRELLQDFIQTVGTSSPFYIDFDPDLSTSDAGELSGYFYFSSDPVFNHVVSNIYSFSFEIEEAV